MLVTLVIGIVIFGLLMYCVDLLPMRPPELKLIVRVLLVIAFIIWLVNSFYGHTGVTL